MSNKVVLYNADLSPPVRAVKTVAKLIGVELELRNLDLVANEQLRQPFLKLNPEHTVPTILDGDFVVWDSHAICAYLVDKYAKDDKLYPKDLQLRAKVNQRLFFDAASLFVRLQDINVPIIRKGAKEIPQDALESIQKAYDILEAFLSTDPFLAGKHVTIADISVGTTVLGIETYAPVQSKKHPHIFAWLKRLNENIPVFEEINGETSKQLSGFLLGLLEKNKSK